MTGSLSAEFRANAAQSSDWGDGLIDLNGYATEDCTFTLILRRDPRFEDDPDADVEIDIEELFSDYGVTRD